MLDFLAKPEFLIFLWEKMCKVLVLLQQVDPGFPGNEDTYLYYITEVSIYITEILKQLSPQLKDGIIQFINRSCL